LLVNDMVKIILFMTYVLLVLLFPIYSIKDKKPERAFCEFIIALFLPFIGFFYLLLFKTQWTNENALMQLDERQADDNSVIMERMDKEINVLPFHEILSLEDRMTKRRLMIEMMFKKADQGYQNMSDTLRDKDPEVAHYGATALQSKKRKIEMEIYEKEGLVKSNLRNREYLKAYIQVLNEYLGFENEKEFILKTVKDNYNNALEIMLSYPMPEKHYFIEKINLDLSLHEYQRAEECCLEFQTCYPEEEEPYIHFLKLYYNTKNAGKFYDKMTELKNSTVEFSATTLDIVRFWDGGNNV